jgi:hypothetical protein
MWSELFCPEGQKLMFELLESSEFQLLKNGETPIFRLDKFLFVLFLFVFSFQLLHTKLRNKHVEQNLSFASTGFHFPIKFKK